MKQTLTNEFCNFEGRFKFINRIGCHYGQSNNSSFMGALRQSLNAYEYRLRDAV